MPYFDLYLLIVIFPAETGACSFAVDITLMSHNDIFKCKRSIGITLLFSLYCCCFFLDFKPNGVFDDYFNYGVCPLHLTNGHGGILTLVVLKTDRLLQLYQWGWDGC